MNTDLHFSSKSAEHYTPKRVLDLTVELFGAIDLDPCADPGRNVPATTHYIPPQDGLILPWEGRVFMNPPYGRAIGSWVSKLIGEYLESHTAEAVALLPARTDTAWFALLVPFPVCFVRGRLTFLGNENPAPFPSCLVYLGVNRAGFTRIFSTLGAVYERRP